MSPAQTTETIAQALPQKVSILKKRLNLSRGFTLIELLVVIAIIGILATVLITQFGSARGKARDSKRVSDITNLRTALELYYDSYSQYPSTTDWTTATSNFVTKYAPGGKQPATEYAYTLSGAGYTLSACLELYNATILPDLTPPADCSSPACGCKYEVTQQ